MADPYREQAERPIYIEPAPRRLSQRTKAGIVLLCLFATGNLGAALAGWPFGIHDVGHAIIFNTIAGGFVGFLWATCPLFEDK